MNHSKICVCLARGISTSKLPLTLVSGSIIGIYTSLLLFIYYMSVTGLRSKYTGFTHSLCTSLARAAHDAIAMEVEVKDSEDRR